MRINLITEKNPEDLNIYKRKGEQGPPGGARRSHIRMNETHLANKKEVQASEGFSNFPAV